MTDLKQTVAELEQRLQASLVDRNELLQQQAATNEVLQVINASSGDLAPVFDAILERAMRLCEAEFGLWSTCDGGQIRTVSTRGVPPAFAEFRKNNPPVYGPGTGPARILAGERVVHIVDLKSGDAYRTGDPNRRAVVDLGGARTVLLVPLLKNEFIIGFITIYRKEVRPYSDKQIALLQTFADQAVIAIENARLFNETKEALERQTATSEILRIISQSPTEVQPVFDAIVLAAVRLIHCDIAFFLRCDPTTYIAVARATPEGLQADVRPPQPTPIDPGVNFPSRAIVAKETLHLPDWSLIELPEYEQRIHETFGVKSSLYLPLQRKGECIGLLALAGKRTNIFGGNEIALAESFRDQAVIAIENTRLFNETKEALERQTATADILRVIASSPSDVQPVFEAIAERSNRLIGGLSTAVYRLIDDTQHLMAFTRISPEADAVLKATFPRPLSAVGWREQIRNGQIVHVLDTEVEWAAQPSLLELARMRGFRSLLLVPLLRDRAPIGLISVTRAEPGSFTSHHVQLLQTFADQSVIAIENARLFNETQEALERQTATAEVLKVISRSAFDLQPVLDTIVQTASRLCDAEFAQIWKVQGDKYDLTATNSTATDFVKYSSDHPLLPGRDSIVGRTVLDRKTVHLPDCLADPEYKALELQKLGQYRSILGVPLLREGVPIGVIALMRAVVLPFTDKQIELVSTFADQAVIAIENVRLFDEVQARTEDLRESLQQQTATADVLKVINSSPGDLKPVFESILENATRICEAKFGILFLSEGDEFRAVALHGVTAGYAEARRREPIIRPGTGTTLHIAASTRQPVQVADIRADPVYTDDPQRFAILDLAGARTIIAVPILKEDKLVGVINIYRTEVRPFTGKQIDLVKNFAAQAVIAIENSRLLNELRESLQQQTATADVLKIISRSTVELETVLDTLVETAARLCRADQTGMFRRRGNMYHLVASRGLSEEAKEFFRTHPFAPDRSNVTGRVASERRTIHVPDVLQDPEYAFTEAQRIMGYRTMLGVPLLREDALLGIFAIGRTRVEPFTPKEIELATSFADQAVIAIENARLFDELRDRQAELRVTFDNMGDGVVMFDAEARLAAWNRNFQEMLELPDAFLTGRPSYAEYFRYLADRGEYSTDLEAQLSRTIEDASREMRFERTRPDGRVIEARRNPVPGGGFVLIYSDITERKHAEEAIRTARDAAEAALRDLQTAQTSLVQAQKMAALGQLTAGIAHEIKNPLNFVNNFSALSVELVEELDDVLKPAPLDDKTREETSELTQMLKGNLEKVVQHGQRADSIVKNMLLHSREDSGERRSVDLNAIVEDSLNLAYHGARAEKKEFNIRLERSFDPAAGMVDLFPQEITRVLLNLISNGVYAAMKRQSEIGADGHEPTVAAATKDLGDRVEIRIRDNGGGIAAEVMDKIFNPFFTTKPPGEGTGLGLSLSHDIVVKQHAGLIEVDTRLGEFTEFKVILPRLAATGKAGADK